MMGFWSQKSYGEGKANGLRGSFWERHVNVCALFLSNLDFLFQEWGCAPFWFEYFEMKPLETKILSLKGKMVQRVVVLLEECYLLL